MAKIYVAQNEDEADATVFYTKHEDLADLHCFEVKDYEDKATGDCLWYFVDNEDEADFSIFKVKREDDADIKIFKVRHYDLAGWMNESQFEGRIG